MLSCAVNGLHGELKGVQANRRGLSKFPELVLAIRGARPSKQVMALSQMIMSCRMLVVNGEYSSWLSLAVVIR